MGHSNKREFTPSEQDRVTGTIFHLLQMSWTIISPEYGHKYSTSLFQWRECHQIPTGGRMFISYHAGTININCDNVSKIVLQVSFK